MKRKFLAVTFIGIFGIVLYLQGSLPGFFKKKYPDVDFEKIISNLTQEVKDLNNHVRTLGYFVEDLQEEIEKDTAKKLNPPTPPFKVVPEHQECDHHKKEYCGITYYE